MSQSEGSDRSSAMIELPDKTYFKIGEVAKLLEVEPYVLRYWETEFDVLEPDKTKSGQRVYQRDDIELLLQIRSLLYEEMFTIAGARRQLERSREGKPSYFDLEEGLPTRGGTAVAGDDEIRQELEDTRRELTAVQTEFRELEDNLHSTRAEARRWEREAQSLNAELLEARQSLDEAPDVREVEHLYDEVARLETALAQAKTSRQSRREHRDRLERRDQMLGTLRREVESIAALAHVESGQWRR
jgi:DNA-binding transcriptional MerR regulator